MKQKLVLAFLACLLVVASCSGVYGKAFYEGKKITLIVATGPGGGYDFYGRLIAKFMEKYLPGSTVIVKNVPGAGHIIGTNEVYHARPDGLTFATFNRGLPLAQVAGQKGVKFDLSKMSWLGSAGLDPLTFVVSASSPFRTLKDVMRAEEIKIGGQGAGTEGQIVSLLFAEMAALKNFNVVPGFRGGELDLAMIRGELHGKFSSWSSTAAFIKEGHGIPILFFSREPIKGYEHVPVVSSVVTKERYKPVLELLSTVTTLGRPFAGPPGIPQDRLEILREAFRKALDDSELIQIATKAHRPIQYTSGDEATRLLQVILRLPPDVVELVKRAFEIK